MVTVGSYMPNLTNPNYIYNSYFNIWGYNSFEYSFVEALRVCQMLGVKLGSFTGLNLKRNI